MTRVAVEPRSDVPARPVLALLGLMLGPAVSLGLARFAYALVLPSMRSALHWSYAMAGALNTANAFGYLGGALMARWSATRFGERRAFIGGFVLTAIALAASAISGNIAFLLILRLIAGAAGAVCLVVGGGLAAQVGREGSRRFATLLLIIYFTGSGVGVLVSGLVLPVVLADAGWRVAWLVLGGLSLFALFAAVPAARGVPETRAPAAHTRERLPTRSLAMLLTCYGLFGAGYIAYMTFIVAYLKAAGAGSSEIMLFWSVLGIGGVTGGFLWRPAISGLRGGVVSALVLAEVTLGALLPVLSSGVAVSFLSAVLFGTSFLVVITTVTTATRDSLPEHQWTAGIAALTVAFALGQCIGPVLSGVLSDGPGGMRSGLLIGAGLLVLAAVSALFHRTPGQRAETG